MMMLRRKPLCSRMLKKGRPCTMAYCLMKLRISLEGSGCSQQCLLVKCLGNVEAEGKSGGVGIDGRIPSAQVPREDSALELRWVERGRRVEYRRGVLSALQPPAVGEGKFQLVAVLRSALRRQDRQHLHLVHRQMSDAGELVHDLLLLVLELQAAGDRGVPARRSRRSPCNARRTAPGGRARAALSPPASPRNTSPAACRYARR